MKKVCLLMIIMHLGIAQGFTQLNTQNEDSAYTKVIMERAAKIVAGIGITDPVRALKVRDIIAEQYRSLSLIHADRNEKIKSLKQQTGTNEESISNEIKEVESKANADMQALHTDYLLKLGSRLTPEQVVLVKDGMTYSVCPKTYQAYQDMIPSLTETQKSQILAWLTEARELAMDAESSDKKHAWFGKYKGKINNYLSAEGYDAEKERAAWEQRLKSRKNG